MKWRVALSLLLTTLSSRWLAAQVPAGGEFLVNTYTTGAQAHAALASDPAGNFVAAWFSTQGSGSGQDVFAQRYDASGTPRGAEFRVNTYTTGDQRWPTVAADVKGAFVVVWYSGGQDGDRSGVFGQRYDESGLPRGSEFQVNTYTTGYQEGTDVVFDAASNFVVVWHSGYGQDGNGWGVFAQRYHSSGAPLGAEFRVNTYTSDDQGWASVDASAGGDFVVVWYSDGQDESSRGVFGQLFDRSGAPRGLEFRVNTYTAGSQQDGAAAFGPAGDFVVAWTSHQDGSLDGVFAQRFDSAGTPLGPEFQVNTYTPHAQSVPFVAADSAGNFVVSWTSTGQDGHLNGVFGQRYDASGARRGAEFQINTYTTFTQIRPVAASDAAGNFVFAWQSTGADGSFSGISAQRFGGILPSALAVDTAASAGSDGNRVLEPGESVDVRPSWRNVNGAAQSFDATILGFGGPPAAGVSYQLLDGTGAYGAVPNGMTVPCSDCYQVAMGFTGTRPAVHWDGTLTERLTPDVLGQTKPWSIHVGDSFMDVPRTNPYYRFVETLVHEGVTAGCAGGAYCPSAVTTREQMAAFVLLAREGVGYAPVPCSPPGLFTDVPESSPFCDVIEELARRGVVSGCGGGNYCPASVVLREQMPVFVLRTLDPTLSPPPCGAPMFADVPASSPFCRWIEELARRGIVTGCGGGNYCPAAPVTREQMAVFISGTFGLTLYGP